MSGALSNVGHEVKIHLFATVAMLSFGLTGCVSIMVGDFTQGRTLPSKWDNQCFVLLQDVDLREARYWPSGRERILATEDARDYHHLPDDRAYGHLKPVDQIPAGTQLRVAKIYDHMSVFGKVPYWYMGVRVQIMQGAYQGLELEIPALPPRHPSILDASSLRRERYWITHPQQFVNYNVNRQDLNPDSIVFDPTILRPCD